MKVETAQDRHYLAEMQQAVVRAAYERMHDATGASRWEAVAMLTRTEGLDFTETHHRFFARNHVTILDEWCWA